MKCQPIYTETWAVGEESLHNPKRFKAPQFRRVSPPKYGSAYSVEAYMKTKGGVCEMIMHR